MKDNRDVGAYFTGLAETYAAHRPSYPSEAFAAMLDGLSPPVQATDIGCGTGISTRLLAACGVNVIGIDPNADMLRAARDAEMPTESGGGTITYLQAPAEHTGLPDSLCDLVLCAQSFHWFDAKKALREFHRILSPPARSVRSAPPNSAARSTGKHRGGRVALLWNIRDTSDPFAAGYEAVVRRAQEDAAERGRLTKLSYEYDLQKSSHFKNVRKLLFPNPQPLDWHGLIGRARSASYFPVADPLRGELEAELRRLFDAHHVNGIISLAQQAHLTLADRE